MYSKVIRKACTLQSGPPDASGTHLALDIVVHIIIDYLPSVVIYRCDCPVIINLYCLIPSPFSSPEKDFFIKLFFKIWNKR